MSRDLRFEEYFLFTQHSLTTFDNCPLKFRKRYLEGLKWDSFPSEKVKRSLERGNDFHLLAQRYFMGIPTGLVEDRENSKELEQWMESLRRSFPLEPFNRYLPEYKLRMVRGTLKLEANFDLVLLKGDKVEIWDWKTHGGEIKKNLRKLKNRLTNSLQTMVYLFVLREQLPMIWDREAESDRIRMCYWQPQAPHIIAEINYSNEMHESFRQILEEKTKKILNYRYSSFDKNMYRNHCRYCEFNWFCNNERLDFNAIEEDEGFLEELEWESIEEKF